MAYFPLPPFGALFWQFLREKKMLDLLKDFFLIMDLIELKSLLKKSNLKIIFFLHKKAIKGMWGEGEGNFQKWGVGKMEEKYKSRAH